MSQTHPSNRITLENLGDVAFYKRPTTDTAPKFAALSAAAATFMRAILEHAPDCADRTTALRAVREARMWANSAIALDPATQPVDETGAPKP